MATMTETSRVNEHDGNAMMHRRKTRLTRGVVTVVVIRWLARRADRRRQPRQGQAGQICHRRNNDEQGEEQRIHR